MTWQYVQDLDENMASLRRAVKNLHKRLDEKDSEIKDLHEEIAELRGRLDMQERLNSRLYIGAVVSRLNDYLAPFRV